MKATILVGDVRERLSELTDGSVQTCVTSPPYWGLRDYGTASWDGGDPSCKHLEVHPQARDGRETPGGRGGSFPHTERAYKDTCGKCGATRLDQQIGLEQTPDAYVAEMVAVFREVRRVLADDGTLWLNLGDSYAGSWGNQGRKAERGTQRPINGSMMQNVGTLVHAIDCDLDDDCSCDASVEGVYPQRTHTGSWVNDHPTLKPKDLVGIPWRVAFALQADGWWLRQDIIWAKPNPMPESVTDRCTKAHEYLFLLTKSARYYYDAAAVAEAALLPPGDTWEQRKSAGASSGNRAASAAGVLITHAKGAHNLTPQDGTRNRRSVWNIATKPFSGAHFAVMPEALVEPCVLAGSRPGDLVLDPFAGSGTVGVVALKHGRDFVGTELNPEYAALAEARIHDDGPLFNEVVTA